MSNKRANFQQDDSAHSASPASKKQKFADSVNDHHTASSNQQFDPVVDHNDDGGNDLRPPEIVTSKNVKSKYIIYPDSEGYANSFNPENVGVENNVVNVSKAGGGELWYVNYTYPDGERRPLRIQAPVDLFTPTGVTTYGDRGDDSSQSMLISMGSDYSSHPVIKSFVETINAIHVAVAKFFTENRLKGLNMTYRGGAEEFCHEFFNPIIFEGFNSKDQTPYPPAMKTSVILAGKSNRSTFFTRRRIADGSTQLYAICSGDVQKSALITAVVSIPWVYRCRKRNTWNYNLKCTIYQAVVKNGDFDSGSTTECNVCN